MSRLLEFRRQRLARQNGRDGKGNQSRRHVQIQERARHGVLAADGGAAVGNLGRHRPQQSLEGLAPTQGICAQLFKVFLQRQIRFFVVRAGSHQLGEGYRHRVKGSPIGTRGQSLRVAGPGHDAGLLRLLPRQYRQQRGH